MSRIESPPASGSVAVFPLPNTVFYPGTVLPLHIFEPRYRAMVRDAAAGDHRLVVTLLKPGWEADYEGSPDFHEIATLGRIEDLEPLPDGRFNLRLIGLARVRLGATIQDKPYRILRFDAAPETPPADAAGIVVAKLDLLATHGCVLRELLDLPGDVVVDDSVSFEQAVNSACASLPIDAEIRQRLLEEDELAVRGRRVAHVLDDLLRRILQLKSLRGAGRSAGEN